MPSDREQSPLKRSSPLIGGSGRPVTPSSQFQHNVTSNLNDPEHFVRARASSVAVQGSVSPASPSITTMSVPSFPPLTGVPVQARHMRNESNRVSSFPDIGNSISLPTRGPLNHNITMGPQRQTSGSSEVSFTSSKSLNSLTIPNTPLLQSTRLPNLSSDVQPRPFTEDNSQASRAAPSGQLGYKQRVRKVPTKEIAPDDIQAVVALGMGPFMVGKDAMTNQNRLVRNEAILTQHVLRLQHSQFQSESVHAKREEDIYRILQEHTASINNILVANKNVDTGASAGAARGPLSRRSDPDFTALVDEQADMRNRLERLMADVAATTLSTKLTLEHLDERIRQLASNLPTSVPPTPASTPLLAHDVRLPRLTQMTRSGVSPERAHRKRKRDEWMANVTPPRPGSGYQHHPSSRHYHSRGQRMEGYRDDISMIDLYDPVSSSHRGRGSSSNYADADDDDGDDRDNWSPPRIRMIANEAVRDVGLSPRMIHSVRRAHDAPAERRARLAEPSLMWSTESGLEERLASGSNSNATMWEQVNAGGGR